MPVQSPSLQVGVGLGRSPLPIPRLAKGGQTPLRGVRQWGGFGADFRPVFLVFILKG